VILAGDTSNYIGGIDTSLFKKLDATKITTPQPLVFTSQPVANRIETVRLISGNKDTTPIIKKDPSITQTAESSFSTALLATHGNIGAAIGAAVGGGAAAATTNLTGGANANYVNPALEALTGQKTPQVSGGNPIADLTGSIKKTVKNGTGGGGGGGLIDLSPSITFPSLDLSPSLSLTPSLNPSLALAPYIVLPGGTGTDNSTSSGPDLFTIGLIGAVALGGIYLLTRGGNWP